MEKKTAVFILSGLLLASFFVPNIGWDGFAMSGFDFVVSERTPQVKYLLLIIPAAALFLLVSTLIDESSMMNNKLASRIPLLVLIALGVFIYSNRSSRESVRSINPFNVFYIGAWIALTASFLLAFNRKQVTD